MENPSIYTYVFGFLALNDHNTSVPSLYFIKSFLKFQLTSIIYIKPNDKFYKHFLENFKVLTSNISLFLQDSFLFV